jgi:hypothetical protein
MVRHKLRCVLHCKVSRFVFLRKPFRLFVFLSQNLQIFCLALGKRAQYVVVVVGGATQRGCGGRGGGGGRGTPMVGAPLVATPPPMTKVVMATRIEQLEQRLATMASF